MFMLEGRLEPVAMLRWLPGALRGGGHDDVRVIVAIIAMRAVRVLDDFDQTVPVRRGIEVVPVEVLVIVAMRHAAILGGRASLTAGAGRS